MKAKHHILLFVWALVVWQLTQPVIVLGAEAGKTVQSPMVTFQEALYQEETEGDLDKAIELYQQVLTEAAEVERLAARAMYQLGMCHLKKGDESQAATYFQKLVNQYPKQTSAVKKAKQQLEKITPADSQTELYDQAPQSVWSTIGSLYGTACAEGGRKGLYTNSRIYFVNDDFEAWSGGYGYYTNTTQAEQTGRIHIGGAFRPDQTYYDVMGSPIPSEIVPDDKPGREQYGKVFLDLPNSLAPGQFYGYSWANKGMSKLKPIPFTDNQYQLKMNNQYGEPVYEAFFLIVPKDMIVEYEGKSDGPSTGVATTNSYVKEKTNKQAIGDFTIYSWERELGSDEGHVVTVSLSKKSTGIAKSTALFNDSFEQGDTNPTGWQMGADVDGVKYLWDRRVGSDGTSSLCLKKTADKYFPIAQWTRTIEHTGNAKELTVTAQVRAKKASKAVIDALFLDEKGEWIKHEWVSYIGAKESNDPSANHNWTPYTGTVEIPGNTQNIVIGLQMYGPGTVWFDEVEVAYATQDSISVGDAEPALLNAENLIAEGWKLWQQRKLAEAESKFQQAVRSDPENDGAYQGLGWAQLNQGKKKNAEQSFKTCVKLNPQNAAALNGLGWIAHGNNDKLRAIQWWEKAVKAQPGATAALSGLTKTYMEIEEYEKAAKYYKMWLKAEPNNQEAKDGLQKAQSMVN